jgi:hypothetical protein
MTPPLTLPLTLPPILIPVPQWPVLPVILVM